MTSPCIKVCKIDEKTQLCTGCLRKLSEVANWKNMTSREQTWVLDDIALVRSHIYKFELEKSI